ncbi:MAG: single-stranded DNA-binding protein [Candidatus Hodarchaeota archaeon]
MSDFEETQYETTEKTIAELQPYDKRIDVVFKVVSKGETREVTSRKTGETHTVCDITVADATGAIILALWDADIDAVTEESCYKIANGYINIFGSSMRLAKGKYGELQDTDESIDEVNLDNNRSNEEHQRRFRQRRYDRDRRGGGFGGGGRGRSNWGDDRGRDRRDRHDRW